MLAQNYQEGPMAVKENVTKLSKALNSVLLGQNEVIDNLLITILSGGHGLVVGVPGLGKTLVIKALAKVLDVSYGRIQFTPDLMPADITGSDVIEEDKSRGEMKYRFIKGPIFNNLILADEINRTPPKTQAAMLQAMEEGSLTALGNTYILPKPFFVFATQNPIEQEGTYPLPEAQLDRFLMMISMDYPEQDAELGIITGNPEAKLESLEPVLKGDELLKAIEFCQEIVVAEHLCKLIVNLVRATRPNDASDEIVSNYLRFGAGPRAVQGLLRASQAKAMLSGRDQVILEDIASVASPVLKHRIILSYHADSEGYSAERIINYLVQKCLLS